MIGAVIEFVASFGIAFLILAVGIAALVTFGDVDRAARAGIQAFRWFLAGAVIVLISDVLESGSASSLLVPGAVALLVLAFSEYHLEKKDREMGLADSSNPNLGRRAPLRSRRRR